MKRGRKLNVRKFLENIKLKENRTRIKKHYQDVIRNHDIAQLLKTLEYKNSEIYEIVKLSNHLHHKVIEFYNNTFSKKVTARVIENHLIMEVLRDLRTSSHLAQFAYYKSANSTLRNVFETGFRFLYLSQFPEKFAEFGKSEDWSGINEKRKKTEC